MKTGVGKKVFLNYRRKVLVVGNMLGKYNECNGNVSNGYSCKIGNVKIFNSLEGVYKGKLRNCYKGVECNTVGNERLEG